MQITGGKASYGRTVQVAQYESKRSDVELTFSLSEGEELGGTLAEVLDMVRDECHRVLAGWRID